MRIVTALMVVGSFMALTLSTPEADAQIKKKGFCNTQACMDARTKAAADKAAADKAAAQALAKKAAKERIKAARKAAEEKAQRDADIAAMKIIAAKRAAEPGITRQVCQMVNGQLQCK